MIIMNYECIMNGSVGTIRFDHSLQFLHMMHSIKTPKAKLHKKESFVHYFVFETVYVLAIPLEIQIKDLQVS